ncbi:uncharacterized protein JCM15063_003708 [Sporobolomyces koalae]|uniref:uncharacterized protein n=1 Tax=Sporobolomyces koalae TaxID=500713 RepID=UPI003179C9E1
MPKRRGSVSSTESESDWTDDSSQELETRHRHGEPAPSTSSALPYLIVGAVFVILAAIGAATWVTTRGGGALEAAGSPARSTPSVSDAAVRTPAENLGATAGGKSQNEAEETAGEGGEDEDVTAPASSVAVPASSANASNTQTVSSSGLYGKDLLLDFTTLKSASELLPYLTKHKLSITNDFIASKPITHSFKKELVDWEDGALRMTVKGQSGNDDIKSSEVQTTDAFLYGRVTTRFKASPVPGVCHGVFWYMDDNHESDFEWLTSYYETGRGDEVKPGLQLTNQALKPGERVSNMVVPYGFDPTADFHDYTLEWAEGVTIFEVDGKEVGRLDSNVPATPMKFIWNSWSSGEPNWSAGPPREDSIAFIAGIAANWTVAS